MNKPHKHAALIKAWADGAEIQYRPGGPQGNWLDDTHPTWVNCIVYRIKPNTIKYRNYLWVSFPNTPRIGVTTGKGKNPPEEMEKCHTFIKWLGDWQEVEV